MTQDEMALTRVVFAITVKGYAELRNTNSILNLQERTVLTLIDGVCPVAQYLPFLSEFNPVIDKLKRLEKLGLLRRVGAVASDAVQRFDKQVSGGSRISHWQSISAEREVSGFIALE
ncbi:MAG: hypothetical protein EAZ37_13855 [Burkholderiales bacterium]|nr:MAG: hypothetical protein EAZ37_13855 [Burkholderiales bacterium]